MTQHLWRRWVTTIGVALFTVVVYGGLSDASAQNCTAKQFASNVQMLKPFDFLGNGGGTTNYSPPTGNDTVPTTSYYYRDMLAAWQAAPAALRIALCNVEKNGGVFIDPQEQAPFAWSFWEVSGQGTCGQSGGACRRYIAVNAKLWPGSPPALNVAGVENLILEHLLGTNNRPRLFPTIRLNGNENRSSDPNGPTDLALMEILAREVGLMLYHDFASYKYVCGPGTSFESYSWSLSQNTAPQETGHIHLFGEETDTSSSNPRLRNWSPYLPSQLRQTAIVWPPQSEVISSLATVYEGQAQPYITRVRNVATARSAANPEWADLLAETTPYDDFAETFRLLMLAQSHNAAENLYVTLGVGPSARRIDEIANLTANWVSDTKSILADKVSCLSGDLSPGNWLTNPAYP